MTVQTSNKKAPVERVYGDWKFSKGDRVTRHLDIGQPALRHGVVDECYRSAHDLNGDSMPMYAIVWDGQSHVERGYLGVDLEKETV